MIKILQVRNIDSFVESRRQKTSEKDRKTVQSILNAVRKNGDSAIKKYERKFNGRKTSQLRVSAMESKETQSKIDSNDEYVIERLIEYGAAQGAEGKLENDLPKYDEIKRSLVAGITRSFVPIPSVGCYIPGGQARYPSSVIMSVELA